MAGKRREPIDARKKADAERLADQLLEERDRYNKLVDHFEVIDQALASVIKRHGPVQFELVDGEERPCSPHTSLVWELSQERTNTWLELTPYGDGYIGSESYRPRAGDHEEHADVVNRILLVRGHASSAQIAATRTDEKCESSDLPSSSPKRVRRAHESKVLDKIAELRAPKVSRSRFKIRLVDTDERIARLKGAPELVTPPPRRKHRRA